MLPDSGNAQASNTTKPGAAISMIVRASVDQPPLSLKFRFLSFPGIRNKSEFECNRLLTTVHPIIVAIRWSEWHAKP